MNSSFFLRKFVNCTISGRGCWKIADQEDKKPPTSCIACVMWRSTTAATSSYLLECLYVNCESQKDAVGGWGVGWRAHCLSAPLAILVKADFDKINVTFARPCRARVRSFRCLLMSASFVKRAICSRLSKNALVCVCVCLFVAVCLRYQLLNLFLYCLDTISGGEILRVSS